MQIINVISKSSELVATKGLDMPNDKNERVLKAITHINDSK